MHSLSTNRPYLPLHEHGVSVDGPSLSSPNESTMIYKERIGQCMFETTVSACWLRVTMLACILSVLWMYECGVMFGAYMQVWKIAISRLHYWEQHAQLAKERASKQVQTIFLPVLNTSLYLLLDCRFGTCVWGKITSSNAY